MLVSILEIFTIPFFKGFLMKPQEKIMNKPHKRSYGKQFRLAITGTVCAGKSTVLYTLQREGCNGLDVSQLAAVLLQRDKALFCELLNWLETQPHLNRLFHQKRVSLVRLLPQIYFHPTLPPALYTFFTQTMSREIKRFLFTPSTMGIVVVEDPLVFEKNEAHLYDELWIVQAQPEHQQQRLAQRDFLTPVDAESAVGLYCYSQQEKQQQASKILYNHGELLDFKLQVQQLYAKLAATLAFYRRYS
jgi:dephospho-CoA kinase